LVDVEEIEKITAMGISEMRRHFTAYGSGELEEVQLRTIIRAAVSREPQLGQECIALTEAYRRANVIGPRLQSNINADILAITAPTFDVTRIGSPAPGPGWTESASFDLEQAANSTEVYFPEDTRRSATRPPAPTGASSTGPGGLTDGLSQAGEPLHPGAVLRERFVLVEELGRGGMGVVYKALDRRRGDVKDPYVAIKVLSEAFKRHPLAVKGLQREARKAQRLAHPNIVAVHDFDHDGGNVFMVMELLSGRSLDHVMREDGHGGIPLRPAMQIIRSLAAALSYAHEHDIVHCDFKPGNAFLGRDGRVKVLDFGIARAAPSTMPEKQEPTLFDAGQLGAASPAYASLELLQGKSPDVRDDVYSFACVVYELLSGVHPFQRIDAVKASQAGLEPRPIRKLSRTQWRALKQGLAFHRAQRSATIDVLAHQLLMPRPKATLLTVSIAAAAAVVAGALVWKAAQVRQNAATLIAGSQPHPIKPAPVVTQDRPATPAPGAADVRASAPPSRQAGAPDGALPAAETQPPGGSRAAESKHVGLEVLKEQFENQAIAGDVEGAWKTGAALVRAAPGSPYATIDVPRIGAMAYLRHAKSQLLAGQVNEALQTLAEGRRKYGRSTELKEQEVKYVAAADLYDRISSAVVLNPAMTRQALDDLKGVQGEDFAATDQMLAQTLADRIADQRAAGRASVADALEKTGRQLFPDHAKTLGRGQAGRLPASPIEINDP
jgi:Protein kinase domain